MNLNKKYYILETVDIAASLTLISETASLEQGSVYGFSAETTAQGHRISFRANFGGRHKKNHQQRFFSVVAEAEQTLSLHTSDEALRAGL